MPSSKADVHGPMTHTEAGVVRESNGAVEGRKDRAHQPHYRGDDSDAREWPKDMSERLLQAWAQWNCSGAMAKDEYEPGVAKL